LLDFGRQYRGLNDLLASNTGRATRAAARKPDLSIVGTGSLPAHYLALADQARGELRSTSVLAARTAENQGVPAILGNSRGFTEPVRGGDLRD